MFPLARPHQSNGFLAVSIYLDEAGQLKRLPPNRRAAGLANLCGFKNVPFVGTSIQHPAHGFSIIITSF